MIDPLPRGSITRASAWQDRNTPSTLIVVELAERIERHRLGRDGAGDAGIVDRDRERPELALGARHRSRPGRPGR